MPDLAGLGAVSSAAQSIPTPLSAFSSLAETFQNQMFSKAMYKKQYDDSIKFWNMQNEYNTPANQMQRFRDAGLNPNLIYGRGESGQAGSIPTPNPNPVDFRIPEGGKPDLMQGLLLSADLDIKHAQADNLKVQNEVIRQDAFLRAIQAEQAGWDLGLDREYGADFRREELRGRKIQNDVSINRDAREAVSNATSVQEAAERMLTMRAERTLIPYRKGQMSAETSRSYESIRQMQLDGTLKKLDIRLRELGLNPSDPTWQRVVGQFLSQTVETGTSSLKGIWEWLLGK